LGLVSLLAAGPAARAVYGEIRTIGPDDPIPGTWVVLGLTGLFQPLGPVEENRMKVVMDTCGAPFGTQLQVHWLSPVPDGWVVLRRVKARVPDGYMMVIKNFNDVPPEGRDLEDPII
jgi:hypothetical protein